MSTMNRQAHDTPTPSGKDTERSLSQVVFVLIGLGIIAAGLWTLYMGNAPYHP